MTGNRFLTLGDNFKYQGMRLKLVELLRSKGITDPQVLEAIAKVPRHLFLDSALAAHAYEDKAMPLGEGQTISQPYTVAFQTQLLQINKWDRVLEIGTGSGYQACVLIEMEARVYSIEKIQKLHTTTKKLLQKLNYNPNMFRGDGTLGLPGYAPFDKIIVTAGAPIVPQALLEQLKINGILVIPVGDRNEQKMLRITKISDTETRSETYHNFKFVPLIGQQGWQDLN
jgi:protein-L-isoaspartate(D-aspartate) O-methyltransferase